MNRWEKLNVGSLVVIVAALISGGVHAAGQEPTPVPSNTTCPPDAWDTFDSLDIEIPVKHGETWRVQCVSTEVESLIGELPPGRFSLESNQHYGVWYVFEWEVLRDA